MEDSSPPGPALESLVAAPSPEAPNSPPPPPPPSYKLYDSVRVGLATLLGSPLAGGWLMALNYRRLGQPRTFWICIILTILGTAALIALGFLLPEKMPGAPLAVGAVIAMAGIAKIQAPQIEEHRARGGKLGSLWKAAGVGILSAVLFLGVVFGSALLDSLRYSKVTFNGGNEVLYDEQTTEADARELGEWLQTSGFFSGGGPRSVVLTRNSKGTFISFVVSDQAANTPATIDTFRKFGQQIEAAGFGKPIIVRLCSPDLKLLREIK